MCRWVLISIGLLSCSPADMHVNDRATQSVTENTQGEENAAGNQAEQTTETCSAPIEMAEGEKTLAELSYEEKSLLGATGLRDKVVVKMPQSVAKWMAWFKTNLSSLFWTARAVHDGKSAFVEQATLSLYSKATGSEDHLPTSSLATNDYSSTEKGYGVVIIGGTPTYPFARVTHRILDYFSDAECTATVSAKGEKRQNNGHFTVKFSNGNEIKILPFSSRHLLHYSNIIFWVGKDNNIKLQRVVGEAADGVKAHIKFETYKKCGEKIPSLDHQCVGDSFGSGAWAWSCDDM